MGCFIRPGVGLEFWIILCPSALIVYTLLRFERLFNPAHASGQDRLNLTTERFGRIALSHIDPILEHQVALSSPSGIVESDQLSIFYL